MATHQRGAAGRRAISDTVAAGAPDAAVADPQAAVPVPAFPPHVAAAIVGTFLILLVGALYYARDFFLPLVLAILVALTFAPLVRALSRRNVPAPLTAVVLVAALGASLVAAAALLSDPVARMVSAAPAVIQELRQDFAFLRRPFAVINDASRELGNIAGGGEAAVVVADGKSPLLSWVAGTIAGIGSTLGITLLLAFFLLAAGDDLRLKLIRLSDHLSVKKRSLAVMRDIENDISRYLITVTAINAGLGTVVGLVMYALGMPNPLLWGIAAGLLNFVPYVGGIVVLVLLVAVSVITFPDFSSAMLPPVSFAALQAAEAYVVTPMVLGRRLELNIVAIIVFLALTTWMWGIVGSIIGVPLLMVVKVFADNFETLSPISGLISAERPVAVVVEPLVPNGNNTVTPDVSV